MNELKRLLEKHREIVGFVLIGGFNTLLTGLIFIALNWFMPYQAAFAATYVIGIVLSYWLNSRFVFRVPMTWKKFLQFPLVYVAHYVFGVVLMYLFVEVAGVPENAAPFLIPLVTTPVTFVLSRLILKTKPSVTPEDAREDA